MKIKGKRRDGEKSKRRRQEKIGSRVFVVRDSNIGCMIRVLTMTKCFFLIES